MAKSKPLARLVHRKSANEGTNSGGLVDSITDPTELALALTDLNTRRILPYGNLRMSSLRATCIREIIIGSKMRLKKSDFIDANLNVIFDIGHGLHWRVQNSDKYFKDMKYGYWRCVNCGKIYNDKLQMRPRICRNCNSYPTFEYIEVDLQLKGITGHIDLLLKIPNKEVLRVMDIKTMKRDQYLELAAPVPDHTYQVTGYVFIADRMHQSNPWPMPVDTKKAYICYVCKEHAGRSVFPLKIFPITPEEFYFQDIENKIFTFTNMYDSATNKVYGLPPPIDECKNMRWASYRAKQCPAKDYCRGYYAKYEKGESNV